MINENTRDRKRKETKIKISDHLQFNGLKESIFYFSITNGIQELNRLTLTLIIYIYIHKLNNNSYLKKKYGHLNFTTNLDTPQETTTNKSE